MASALIAGKLQTCRASYWAIDSQAGDFNNECNHCSRLGSDVGLRGETDAMQLTSGIVFRKHLPSRLPLSTCRARRILGEALLAHKGNYWSRRAPITSLASETLAAAAIRARCSTCCDAVSARAFFDCGLSTQCASRDRRDARRKCHFCFPLISSRSLCGSASSQSIVGVRFRARLISVSLPSENSNSLHEREARGNQHRPRR